MNDTNPLDQFECTLNGLTATAKDGRTFTLDRCAWAVIAPCGCMSGLTLAVIGEEVLMTEEKALRSFHETAAEAKAAAQYGQRAVLVTMDDYRNGILDIFKTDCPHTPKFGRQSVTRTVSGLTWTKHGSAWETEGFLLHKPGRWWSLDGVGPRRGSICRSFPLMRFGTPLLTEAATAIVALAPASSVEAGA